MRYVTQATVALVNNLAAANGAIRKAVFPTCTVLQHGIEFPHPKEGT
jgi:hypothetical protein